MKNKQTEIKTEIQNKQKCNNKPRGQHQNMRTTTCDDNKHKFLRIKFLQIFKTKELTNQNRLFFSTW